MGSGIKLVQVGVRVV